MTRGRPGLYALDRDQGSPLSKQHGGWTPAGGRRAESWWSAGYFGPCPPAGTGTHLLPPPCRTPAATGSHGVKAAQAMCLGRQPDRPGSIGTFELTPRHPWRSGRNLASPIAPGDNDQYGIDSGARISFSSHWPSWGWRARGMVAYSGNGESKAAAGAKAALGQVCPGNAYRRCTTTVRHSPTVRRIPEQYTCQGPISRLRVTWSKPLAQLHLLSMIPGAPCCPSIGS